MSMGDLPALPTTCPLGYADGSIGKVRHAHHDGTIRFQRSELGKVEEAYNRNEPAGFWEVIGLHRGRMDTLDARLHDAYDLIEALNHAHALHHGGCSNCKETTRAADEILRNPEATL